MSRYAVFIDGGYFRHALVDFGKPSVSFLKLSEAVGGHGLERLRTYYYHCPPFLSNPATPDERSRQSNFDRFITALERLPRFQVRLGRLVRRPTVTGVSFEEKKVDVLLAVDLVRLSATGQIQRAVLFAGDSDFVPAIQVARDEGVLVQLYYSHQQRPHDELLRACDERIPIDQAFIDGIMQ